MKGWWEGCVSLQKRQKGHFEKIKSVKIEKKHGKKIKSEEIPLFFPQHFD
jgi:hypothetical protein